MLWRSYSLTHSLTPLYLHSPIIGTHFVNVSCDCAWGGSRTAVLVWTQAGRTSTNFWKMCKYIQLYLSNERKVAKWYCECELLVMWSSESFVVVDRLTYRTETFHFSSLAWSSLNSTYVRSHPAWCKQHVVLSRQHVVYSAFIYTLCCVCRWTRCVVFSSCIHTLCCIPRLTRCVVCVDEHVLLYTSINTLCCLCSLTRSVVYIH